MREVIIEKLWGQERVLHNDAKYCMKELRINPGFKSSLHMHPIKEETFLVIAGVVMIELDSAVVELPPGSHVTIPPCHRHRFWTTSPRCVVVEASTEHSDHDVVRFEQSRSTMEHIG